MSTTFTREDLLAERLTGVGGSDVARLLNIEPYGCARQLWYEKRGAEKEFEPFADRQEILDRGNELEPVIARMYQKKTGNCVIYDPLAQRHPKHPELLVHIDLQIIYPAPDSRLAIGEIKTAGRDAFFKLKREGLPAAYILQLQHAMSVTGAKLGVFIILWPDGWQLLHFEVERDEEMIQMINAESLTFWAQVKDGTPPDRLDVDDERCASCPYQIQCQGSAMQSIVDGRTGPQMDERLAPLTAEYLEAHAATKEADEWKAGVKEQLSCELGDRTEVLNSAGKVLFNPSTEWDELALAKDYPEKLAAFRTKVDWTGFGKANAELAKDYRRTGTTRPLRVYPPKKGK